MLSDIKSKSPPKIYFLQAKDDELEKAIEAALVAGYRHIDTAYVYENEKIIGKVIDRWISAGKLKRKPFHFSPFTL